MSYDSPYPKKRRRNESKLQVHIEALLEMQNQGFSIAMMQEHLASSGLIVNTTTIWRYIKKQITRQAGQSNLIDHINQQNVYEKKVESITASNYQQNSTDNSLQKSTLEKLNDLSNAENEF